MAKKVEINAKINPDIGDLNRALKNANISVEVDAKLSSKAKQVVSDISKSVNNSKEMDYLNNALKETLKQKDLIAEQEKKSIKNAMEDVNLQRQQLNIQKQQYLTKQEELKTALKLRQVQVKSAKEDLFKRFGSEAEFNSMYKIYQEMNKKEKVIQQSKERHVVDREKLEQEAIQRSLNRELNNLKKIEEAKIRFKDADNRLIEADAKINEYKTLRSDPDFDSTELDRQTMLMEKQKASAQKEINSLVDQYGDFLYDDNKVLQEQLRLTKEIEKTTERINFLNKEHGRIQSEISKNGRFIGEKTIESAEATFNANKEKVAPYIQDFSSYSRLNQMSVETSDEMAQKLNNQSQIIEIDRELSNLTTQYKKLDTMKQKVQGTTTEEKNVLKSLVAEQRKVAAQEKQSMDIMKKKNKFMQDAIAYTRSYFSAMVIISTLTATFRKAVDYTIEFDKALTEIAIVTGRTKDSVRELSKEYIKMANELGLSTKQVAEAAVIYFQQGKNQAEVNNMVRATAVAAGLAGITIEDAASRMTSAMNAYKLESESAMDVTDKFSILAAETASDFEELTSAFTRVGASANLAGVDMDTMLGILASNIEVLRESPESIGTAWKTIIARMREVTSADFMEGMRDEEGELISLNRVEKALRTANIDLRDQETGQFREIGVVLNEVGQKWKTLDTNTKAYLATTISGARQQSRFIAAMDNWDGVIKNIEISQNSAGKSSEQYDKKLSSLETALVKLQAAAEKFFTQIINPDAVAGFINGLSGLLSLIGDNKYVAILGSLAAAFGILFSISEKHRKSQIDELASIERQNILRRDEEKGIIRSTAELKKLSYERAEETFQMKNSETLYRRVTGLKGEMNVKVLELISSISAEKTAIENLNSAQSKYITVSQMVDSESLDTTERLLLEEEATEQLRKGYLELAEAKGMSSHAFMTPIKEGNATEEELNRAKKALLYGQGLTPEEKSELKTKDYMMMVANRMKDNKNPWSLITESGGIGTIAKVRSNWNLLGQVVGEVGAVTGKTGIKLGLAKAQIVGISLATRVSTVAMQMFSTEMLAMAAVSAVATAGITAVLGIASAFIGNLWKELSGEGRKERAKKAFEEVTDSISKLEEKKTKIDELITSYDELTLKEQLSAEEKLKLNEITSELTLSIDGLTTKYDENGRLLITNTQRLKEYREEQEKLLNIEKWNQAKAKLEVLNSDMPKIAYKRSPITTAGSMHGGSAGAVMVEQKSPNKLYFEKNPYAKDEFKTYAKSIMSLIQSSQGIDLTTFDGKIQESYARAELYSKLDKLFSGEDETVREINFEDIEKIAEDTKIVVDKIKEIKTTDKNGKVSTAYEQLEEITKLAESGNFNTSEINEGRKKLIDIIKKELPDMDLTSILGSDLKSFLNKFEKAQSSYEEKVSKTIASTKFQKESFDALASSLTELSETGTVSLENLESLTTKLPEVAEYLSKTGDLEFRGLDSNGNVDMTKEVGSLLREQLAIQEKRVIVEKERRNLELKSLNTQKELENIELKKQMRTASGEEAIELKTMIDLNSNFIALNEDEIQQNKLLIELQKQLNSEASIGYELSKKTFDEKKNKYTSLNSLRSSIKENGLTADSANTIATEHPELLAYLNDSSKLLQQLSILEDKTFNEMQDKYNDMLVEKAMGDKGFFKTHQNILNATVSKEKLISIGLTEAEANSFIERMKNIKTFNEAKIKLEELYTSKLKSELAKRLLAENDNDASIALNKLKMYQTMASKGMIGPGIMEASGEQGKAAEKELSNVTNMENSIKKMEEDIKKETAAAIGRVSLSKNKDSSEKDTSSNKFTAYEIATARLNAEIEKLIKNREYLSVLDDKTEYKKNINDEIKLREEQLRLDDIELKKKEKIYNANSNIKAVIKEVNDFLKNPKNTIKDLGTFTYNGKNSSELSQEQKQAFDDYTSLKKKISDDTATLNTLKNEGNGVLIQGLIKENERLAEKKNLLNSIIESYSKNKEVSIEASKQLIASTLKERKNLEGIVALEKERLELNTKLTDAQREDIKKNLEESQNKLASLTNEKENAEKVVQSLLATRNLIYSNLEHSKNMLGEINTTSESIKVANIITQMMEQKKKSLEDISNYIQKEIMPLLNSKDKSERDTGYAMYSTINESLKTTLEEYVTLVEDVKTARIQIITAGKESLDKLNAPSESIINLYSSLNEILANGKVSDRLKNIAKQYEETSRVVEQNKKFFNELSTIIPKSEEEAGQLATTLSDVSLSIIDGQKSMLELNNTFQEGRISYVADQLSKSLSILNGQITILDNNISLLSNGYQETANLMLNFTGLDSDFQTQETDKIVNEEKTRAEKIKKIKETAIEDEIKMIQEKYKITQKQEITDFKSKVELMVANSNLSKEVSAEYLKQIDSIFVSSNESMADSISGVWDATLEKIKIIADEITSLSNKMQKDPNKVNIWDAKGNLTSGYQKEGKTYLADGTRLPVGYTVEGTNGKYYKMTKNGGVEVKSAPNTKRNKVTVKIWDAEGNPHYGYMENGATYLADGSRLPVGWTVKTPEGIFWKMGSDGKGIKVSGPPEKNKDKIGDTEKLNFTFDEKSISNIATAKLNTSSLSALDSIEFDDTLSSETLKKIDNFKTKRIDTDKVIKDAQKTLIDANKLGIDTQEETEKLAGFISSRINEDQLFLISIKTEAAEKKLLASQEALTEIEKQYNNAVANGTVTESLKNRILEARTSISEQILAIDSLIIEKHNQELAIQQKIYDGYQKKIDLVQAEYNLSVELGGKLSEQSLLKSKENLKYQNEKFRVQQDFVEKLRAEMKLLSVGTTEWLLKSEELSKNETDIVTKRQELLKLTKEIKANEINAQLEIFEKSLLNGKTVEEIKKEKQKYISGKEKELAVENILNEVAKESLNLTSEQYAILKSKEKIKRSELEAIQKEIELQKLQIKLDELRNNKTIQQLTKDQFGNWNYQYVADQEAIEAAEKEMANAEVEYENWKSEQSLINIETYISDIREIMEKAFNGDFGTFVQIEQALRNIENVGNSSSVTESIVVKLGDYMNSINQIVRDVGGFNLPAVNTNSTITNSQIESITQITISEVSFPNATSRDEIQSALTGLQELAKQKQQSSVGGSSGS